MRRALLATVLAAFLLGVQPTMAQRGNLAFPRLNGGYQVAYTSLTRAQPNLARKWHIRARCTSGACRVFIRIPRPGVRTLSYGLRYLGGRSYEYAGSRTRFPSLSCRLPNGVFIKYAFRFRETLRLLVTASKRSGRDRQATVFSGVVTQVGTPTAQARRAGCPVGTSVDRVRGRLVS